MNRSLVWLTFVSLAVGVAPAAEIPFGPQRIVSDSEGFGIDVIAGDLDGDGDADLVGSGGTTPSGVYWYENLDGAGSFAAARVIDDSSGGLSNHTATQLVDMDGDGDLDLLTGSYSFGAWYPNDGQGNFGARTLVRDEIFTGAGYDDFRAADLDSDGDLDVVGLSGTAFGTDKLVWFTNLGGGSFNPATENFIDALVNENGLGHAIPADVDGDGDLDLVTQQTASGDHRVVWYRNTDGAGTFSAKLDVSTAPQFLADIDVADVDGDGDPDVISVDYGFNAARWHENVAGDGSVWVDHDVATSSSVSFFVDVADLDLDGDPDVLLSARVAGELRWVENTSGDGSTWTNRLIPGDHETPRALLPVDIDGDGDLDVAAASGVGNDDKFTWNENRTIHRNAAFDGTESVIGAGVDGPTWVYPIDLDRDGDTDVVAASEDEGTIRWFESDGTLPEPGWTSRLISATVGQTWLAWADDVDGDGDVDALAASLDGNTIAWYENDGATPPGWTERVVDAAIPAPTSVRTVDLDRDGDLDLLATAQGSALVRWYESDGALPPGWTARDIATDEDFARSADVADLDRDGDLDVMVASMSEATVSWYENDGASPPGWTKRTIATGTSGANYIQAVDLDRDGDVDAVTAEVFNEAVRWHESDGGSPPSFTTRTIAVIDGTNSLWTAHAADMDHDGDVDVIAATTTDGVAWYENNGASPPGWSGRTIVNDSDVPRGVFVGDVDGDGDGDVLSAGHNLDKVVWYANRGGQYALADGSGELLLPEGEEVALVAVTTRLNGRPGDSVGRLESLDLLFEDDKAGAPISTGEAAGLFETIRIYRDDGSGIFEPGVDFLVRDHGPLTLTGGAQSVPLAGAGNPNALVAAPATFFAVAQMTSDADGQGLPFLGVTHLNDQSVVLDDASGIWLAPEFLPEQSTYAFEIIGRFVVDSPADGVDASPGDGACATGGGQCTLRAAVQEANVLAGTNRISLGQGTHVLTVAGQGEEAAATGDLDVTSEIEIVGAGADVTVVDAAGLDRVFHVQGSGALTLRDLTVTGGDVSSDRGAGVRVQGAGASLTVERCRVTGNIANIAGGIDNVSGFVTIARSTIDANVGLQSMALENFFGTMDVTDSTISGNTGSNNAITNGSGGSVMTLTNCTVTGNEDDVSGGGTVTVTNTIIAGNDLDVAGSFVSGGHNLIGDGDGATGFTDGVDGDQVGTAGSPLDALLEPLGDHGGTTLTHALRAGSPAMDQGSCSGTTADQRGRSRPFDVPGVADADDGCDVGAFEARLAQTEPPLQVPIRWCGLRGAPSVEDPGLLGAATVNDLLRRRHEVASAAIYGPQGNILFRSAANEAVEDYPVLDDPDCVEGPPGTFTCERGQHGDVFIDPAVARFEEFEALIAACRQAWFEQDPEITGITAVHVNRFIDRDGAPLEILGIGGRAKELDATEQEAAGRVMVVDSLYRRDVPGNPGTPPVPEDLVDRLFGHEVGHALSLRHGNGLDDDQDGRVDNGDDAAVGLPTFDGPNVMQYRAGTELTAGQVAQVRAHAAVTVPDVVVQPLVDSIPDGTPIDPASASVLDFGFAGVLDLASASVLDFRSASVLDFENEQVLEFENARLLDFRSASVLDFRSASVLDFGMNFRGSLPGETTALHGTTGALPWPAALRPATRYYFYLDVDRTDATGAYPRDKQIPGEEPLRFPGGNNFVGEPDVAVEAGVDLIAVVALSSSCPAQECSSDAEVRVYDYNDATGEYEEMAIPEPTPAITAVGVGLYLDNGGAPVELEDVPTAVTIQPEIPNSVLFAAGWGFTTPGGGGDPIPNPVRMEVVSTIECAGNVLNDDPSSGDRDCQCTDCGDCPDYPGCTGTTGTPNMLADTTVLADCKSGELTFQPPVLPSCVVVPQHAGEGDPATVYVRSLPTGVGSTVEVTLDEAVLGTVSTATIDAAGATSVAVTLPAGATGNVVLSAGIQGLAPRAQCTVSATPAPDCADSDGDGTCDGADVDDDNDGVTDGDDSQPLNPIACRDVDGDLCDDCSSGTDDPSRDGPDFDLDGLCDFGDPDDDNDGVTDGSDGEPRNANACGDTDGDACDDCVIAAMPSPGNDGPDFDLDGLCDFGDPDDDGDGTADWADCAAFDDTLRTAPAEVGGVGFVSKVRLVWDSTQAEFGSATVTDVLRGELSLLPVGTGGESCLLDDDGAATFLDDAQVPAAGEAFWYLVRGDNACGLGSYGSATGGAERVSTTCP